jgi:S-adenosylmethionine-dependent methyltransferase
MLASYQIRRYDLVKEDSPRSTRSECRVKMAANPECDRFLGGAQTYAAYLDTPEGRLRSDLAFANLQTFWPPPSPQPQRALDVGAGTGALALRLAGLGFYVTLLDSSPAMLEIADRAARESGMSDRILLKEGDASQVPHLFSGQSFDVILCHNVLEFVDDPCAVLHGMSRVMTASALLSVLVRTQAGEVFKAAIQAGDLSAAQHSLTAEWGCESLFKGRVRLFAPGSLEGMLNAASLVLKATHGVRVLSDYLPPAISRVASYQEILELERKLGSRPEFAAVARYAQYLAGPARQPAESPT